MEFRADVLSSVYQNGRLLHSFILSNVSSQVGSEVLEPKPNRCSALIENGWMFSPLTYKRVIFVCFPFNIKYLITPPPPLFMCFKCVPPNLYYCLPSITPPLPPPPPRPPSLPIEHPHLKIQVWLVKLCLESCGARGAFLPPGPPTR